MDSYSHMFLLCVSLIRKETLMLGSGCRSQCSKIIFLE